MINCFHYTFTKHYKINDTIDSSEDLLDQFTFETRMSRVLLITNNYMKDNIGAKLCELYLKHNNYIINTLTNKKKYIKTT